MKPATKYLVYGGVATMFLGPATVAGVMVSLGQGAGTFAGITVEDGIPAVTDGWSSYDGGNTPGMFGDAVKPPLGSAPGGPANPS